MPSKTIASAAVPLKSRIRAPTWPVPLFRYEVYVRLDGTIESFERVGAGEFDHLPEQAFYSKGGSEQVIEAAREMGVEV